MPRFDGIPVDDSKGQKSGGRFGGIPVGEKAAQKRKPQGDSNWYDPIRSALQGATLGFSDEIGAGVAAVPASMTTDATLGEAYSDIHGALGEEREQYSQEHPVASTALEIGGALPTGMASCAKVLGYQAFQKLPALGKGLSLAGLGAAEGGAYGAGSAEPGERASGAGMGAAIGGAAAPLASMGASAVGSVGRPVVQSLSEYARYTPKTQAKEVLRRTADNAGLTSDDIVEQYGKLGDEGMLADVDENFRGLTRALSDRSGTAKQQARQSLEGRQMGSVDRLVDTMEQSTGRKAREFADNVKAIKAERNEKAVPLYEEAWTARPSEEMVKLAGDRPAVKSAMRKAQTLAADEGEDVSNSLFKQFHYAKMAIDDKIGRALTSNRQGSDNQARTLMTAKNDLLAAMDEASPSYREARNIYAGDSELLNAAAKGQDLFKMRADEIDEFVPALGDSERQMFKEGAVKAIVDRLEDSQLTHDNARKLINSKSMQRKLGNLFDSPEELRSFVSQAVREREFGRTRQVVTGGSPTSQNLQMQKQLEDDAAQAFSFLDSTKTGIVSSVLRALKGKPITPETIDEASSVLLDNGLTPAQIREIFTRSQILEGAEKAAPTAGNAARGAVVPAGGAAVQD